MERTDPQLLSKEVTGTLPVAVQWQWQHTEQNPRARRMKGFWRGGGQTNLRLGSAVMKSLNCRWLEKHLWGDAGFGSGAACGLDKHPKLC